MELQHFGHKHLLTLCVCKEGNDDVGGHGKKETCEACRKPISGDDSSSSFYSCTQCNLFLHKFCAELPQKMINNIFHPAHQLELGYTFSSNNRCGVCDERVNMGYHCDTCNFSVHATCALKPTFVQMSVHEHPLTFFEESDVGSHQSCEGCEFDIKEGDPAYSCVPCKFFIHKSCAESPHKIRNMFHPAHHLELKRGSLCFECDICEKPINARVQYYCPLCYGLRFHLTCALQSTFEPEGHEHSFMLVKATIFTCDGCGEKREKECVSNVCTTCQLQVHTKCTSTTFPHTLKQMGHIHQLTLTYSFQLDFVDQPCKICTRKLKCELCVYYCSICPYFAHISCATSEYLKEPEPEPEPDKMAALKMMEEDDDENQEHNNNNPEDKIKHVSHEHCLILSSNDDDDESKRDEICDGCAKPVGVLPFYTCAEQEQCNFFLHKRCVELPNKIVHPLHVHPLTLHADIRWRIDRSKHFYMNDVGICRCHGCTRPNNGFIYACDHCEEENFFLDVTCSLFSDTIQHEGHRCDLKPILGEENTECDACGMEGEAKYRCEGCNFNLGLGCAKLKDTTHECQCRLYDCDIRPLKLTYKAEDDSGEYYCDMCGERRRQNDWFYYCEDCKFASHLYCIHGQNYSLKFGKSYQIKYGHPHSLTLVEKAKGNPTCVACDRPCGISPVLECAECDVRMHVFNRCTMLIDGKFGFLD